jgi:hypothetical protein
MHERGTISSSVSGLLNQKSNLAMFNSQPLNYDSVLNRPIKAASLIRGRISSRCLLPRQLMDLNSFLPTSIRAQFRQDDPACRHPSRGAPKVVACPKPFLPKASRRSQEGHW